MKWLGILALVCLMIPLLSAKELTIVQFEQRIFELVNQERIQTGLEPLIYNADLASLAKRHSRNMAWDGYFDHIDKQGRSVLERQQEYLPGLLQAGIGENLFFNERSDRKFSPEGIVSGWMSSEGHSENILLDKYTHTGVGVFLLGDKLYTTQVYAIPILKLLTKLPKKIRENNTYLLKFEYLCTQPPKSFQCMLTTPDSKKKVLVSEDVYYEGSLPLQIIWRDATHLSLELNFNQGKGKYTLQTGWDGCFYPDMLIFNVN